IRGGFVEAVNGTVKQLDAGAQMFEDEPIYDVTVTGVDDSAAKKLAKSAWLPRARRLVVKGGIGDAGFAALVTAPGLQGVRSLNVTSNGIKDLAPLADKLPQCRSLSFTANNFGDAGLAQLAKWQHLALVETLYLTKVGATEKGVGKLLDVAM